LNIPPVPHRWTVSPRQAVAIQKHLADRVRSFVGQASEGTAYVPRVLDIRYPGRLTKAERIAGLEWRFRQHKFRLPAHRKHEFPIRETFYQLENFTMDLSLLRFDDAADTIAMHQYVIRRSGVRKQQAPKIRSSLEHIQDGVLFDEDSGVPFITGVDAKDLDQNALNALRAAHYGKSGLITGEPEIPVWTPGPFGRPPQ